jgi:hypothetical protein
MLGRRLFIVAGERTLRTLLNDVPRLPMDQQAPRLRTIAREHPHSVRLARRRYRGKTQYTCFLYATGLLWSPKYIRIAGAAHAFRFGKHTPFFAGPIFIRQLLDSGVLAPILSGNAREGDIVIYMDGVAPKHGGKIANEGLIRSKWGDGGRLFDHDLWDVPLDYGEEVQYFRAITRADALGAFVTYVRSCENFEQFQEFCDFEI